ncbi:hypothetical protein PAXRUDRAFT_829906 [Paxillus rubicundulus Ve08.2h10]|uniref:Uncharacterized protein n=1 Tax=Paxillus rubicundulus Ve08.2h10 TaxID=930991 RepID=A0A0D0D6P8_9AGAM|nr:hypothetical protein PAXRUDRAFT_829906 [Paxillus rubicundulus Ve08.2h10]
MLTFPCRNIQLPSSIFPTTQPPSRSVFNAGTSFSPVLPKSAPQTQPCAVASMKGFFAQRGAPSLSHGLLEVCFKQHFVTRRLSVPRFRNESAKGGSVSEPPLQQNRMTASLKARSVSMHWCAGTRIVNSGETHLYDLQDPTLLNTLMQWSLSELACQSHKVTGRMRWHQQAVILMAAAYTARWVHDGFLPIPMRDLDCHLRSSGWDVRTHCYWSGVSSDGFVNDQLITGCTARFSASAEFCLREVVGVGRSDLKQLRTS